MISKWYELKNKAVQLRRCGKSIGNIERRLGIPRSTLSGWFKHIKLSQKQIDNLLQFQKQTLTKARNKASIWHRTEKEKRLQKAEKDAVAILKNINVHDTALLELTLAVLYIGEGYKKTDETGIGSSDPLILKFFLAVLKRTFKIPIEQIRCELNLRADQNPLEIKQFWAKELRIPLSNFKQVNIDKRTIGSKTYTTYKGVCQLRCGNVAIQRKLINICKIFFNNVINKYLYSYS